MTLKNKKLFVLIAPIVVVWIIDQITKHWVRYSLELHRYEIIEGWLAFNYTQNPGMALGMDWISTPTISIIALTATIGISIYILKTLEKANFAYLFCMGLILGGAFGNITDRLTMGLIEGYGGVLHGHVIDFIHFTLTINDTPVFPYIFNVADIAISTSIIAMLLFHKMIMPVEEDEKSEADSGNGNRDRNQDDDRGGVRAEVDEQIAPETERTDQKADQAEDETARRSGHETDQVEGDAKDDIESRDGLKDQEEEEVMDNPGSGKREKG